MTAPRPATINEVARKARVSPATVSRLFNHPGLFDPDTAARVRRALNFRPSRVGRNLRAEATRTLGVLVPTLANPVFAECLDGIAEAARDAVGALAAAGHRHIAMVAGSFKASDRAQLRYLGYRDALRAAGRAAQDPVEVLFRPEDVRIADGEAAHLRGTVVAAFFLGDHTRLMVDTGGAQPVVVETTERRTFRQGEPLGLAVNPDAVLTLER